MSEMKKKQKEHWDFLQEFLETVIFESPNIEMTDEQIKAFREELRNIRYGYDLCWPHAWKHGWSEYYKMMREEEKE